MTTGTQLISRVRSQINEPTGQTDPQRTDAEILQWLDDAQFDMLHKIGAEHFPELVTESTATAQSIALPADYLFFCDLQVYHTISGTYCATESAFVLGPDESYPALFWPGSIGAWAQIRGSTMHFGPSAISCVLRYLKTPTQLSTGSVTLALSVEFEDILINYATSKALDKINDVDADKWMARYDSAIAARAARGEAKQIERA